MAEPSDQLLAARIISNVLSLFQEDGDDASPQGLAEQTERLFSSAAYSSPGQTLGSSTGGTWSNQETAGLLLRFSRALENADVPEFGADAVSLVEKLSAKARQVRDQQLAVRDAEATVVTARQRLLQSHEEYNRLLDPFSPSQDCGDASTGALNGTTHVDPPKEAALEPGLGDPTSQGWRQGALLRLQQLPGGSFNLLGTAHSEDQRARC